MPLCEHPDGPDACPNHGPRPRSETPITLPEWVVRYLAENAYGQYTVAEAILAGKHGSEELEAATIILDALTGKEPSADIIVSLSRKRLGVLNSLITYAVENIPGGPSEDERDVARFVGRWLLETTIPRDNEKA